MLEALSFQIVDQLFPGGMPPLDKRLGDEDVDVPIDLEKSFQADIVAEKVVCQKVVGQIVEKALRWQRARIIRVIKQAGVIVFDDEPLFGKNSDFVLYAAGKPVFLFREDLGDGSRVEHQPRFAAEAGESAYFLLFSRFRIARRVITGPCICNCSRREAEKAARISAYGFKGLFRLGGLGVIWFQQS